MIIPDPYATSVPYDDRGLQYGDGCFSTVLIEHGVAQHWPLHRQRLQWGLDKLAITGVDFDAIEQHMRQQANELGEGVIKLTVTRGSGGRGYSPPAQSRPRWWLSQHTIPDNYRSLAWRQSGLTLGISSVRLAKQPLLAGFKHLNRLEQVLVKQEISQKGWQDALVLDTDGAVIETSSANVFWKKDDEFYTPRLDQCGIKGIQRCLVIRALKAKGIEVHRVREPVTTILSADHVFACNSIMGTVSVSRVDSSVYTHTDCIEH